MSDKNRQERAEMERTGKLGFIRHACTYLTITAALAVLNNLTWAGYQWWLWPALGWGIAVLAHFVSAFVLRSGALRSRLVEREIEKMERTDA